MKNRFLKKEGIALRKQNKIASKRQKKAELKEQKKLEIVQTDSWSEFDTEDSFDCMGWQVVNKATGKESKFDNFDAALLFFENLPDKENYKLESDTIPINL